MRFGFVSFLLVFVAKYSQASEDGLTCNTMERKNGTVVSYNTCTALRDFETYQCNTPKLADGKKCMKDEQTKAHSRFYPCVPRYWNVGNGITEIFELCAVDKTSGNSSKVEYIPCDCKYNQKECDPNVYGIANTMCLHKNEPRPSCGEVLREGLNKTEELQIVDLHNELRARVASGNETGGMVGPQPAASNMRKLEWNNDLAAVAQRWAYQCWHKGKKTLMNDYNRGVMPWAGKDSVGENSLVGQNIGYSLHSQEKSTSDLLNLMIKDIWYSQVSTLGPYYTQMVWADTEAVGCGFLTTKDISFEEDHDKMAWMGGKSWVESVLVCNYGPTGNVKATATASSLIYKQGKAGTACPVGTQASPSGLCQKLTEK